MALSLQSCADLLKAVGEPTRLRLVALLSRNDLTVSDLVIILGQSQPRISRHLKLLVESGVLSRYQEGSWAFFRVAEEGPLKNAIDAALSRIAEDDPVLLRDRERLDQVRGRRAERAADYFARNAARWDRLRSLHVPDGEVEAALLKTLGGEAFESLLDVGTGTGRILELLGSRARRALGIDASREMLSIARAKLDAADLTHVTVRQGDAYRLPPGPGAGFDLVTLHLVLHYLDDPVVAIREAAAVLSPGGRLVVVDFAPHEHEFLRDEHAHLRLGFSREAVEAFFTQAGLACETVVLLAPPDRSDNRLTVSVFVGRRPSGAAAAPALASNAA